MVLIGFYTYLLRFYTALLDCDTVWVGFVRLRIVLICLRGRELFEPLQITFFGFLW